MEDSPRFAVAVESQRPYGAHRLEAFSAKLNRRLRLYSYSTFDLWLMLEADPAVATFCERPIYIESGAQRQLVDFWVRYFSGREELLILDPGEAAQSQPGHALSSGIDLRMVKPADLAAQRVWCRNWQRMLPCLVAHRNFISSRLMDGIASFAVTPQRLLIIEREFATGDPILVRAAIFALLYEGRLSASELLTEDLSLLTTFLALEQGT